MGQQTTVLSFWIKNNLNTSQTIQPTIQICPDMNQNQNLKTSFSKFYLQPGFWTLPHGRSPLLYHNFTELCLLNSSVSQPFSFLPSLSFLPSYKEQRTLCAWAGWSACISESALLNLDTLTTLPPRRRSLPQPFLRKETGRQFPSSHCISFSHKLNVCINIQDLFIELFLEQCCL